MASMALWVSVQFCSGVAQSTCGFADVDQAHVVTIYLADLEFF